MGAKTSVAFIILVSVYIYICMCVCVCVHTQLQSWPKISVKGCESVSALLILLIFFFFHKKSHLSLDNKNLKGGGKIIVK